MNFPDYVKVNARICTNREVHNNAKLLLGKLGALSPGEYNRKLDTMRSEDNISAEDYEFYLDIVDMLVASKGEDGKVFTPDPSVWHNIGNGCHMRRTHSSMYSK